MNLAGTGHRPDKILVGHRNAYDPQVMRVLVDFGLVCLEQQSPELVITGMAQGWDQALAQGCVECGLPFVAAVPFRGQESRWPEKARRTYHWLLKQAQEVRTLGRQPTSRQEASQALLARNVFMVNEADRILALWNGDRVGGTAHAVNYAERMGRPVVNVWPDWLGYAGRPALHTAQSL